jgi:hypothetical protein
MQTLCAALYTNVVKVLTPKKSYAHSMMGALPIEISHDELQFKTRDNGYGYVYLHPSSVYH